MKQNLNKITIFLTILIIVNFLCLPAFAEELPAEAEKETIYITEDTTLWDVVESTNPDAEDIPDEVKENLKKQLVEQPDKPNMTEMVMLGLSMVMAVKIGRDIFIKSKKR